MMFDRPSRFAAMPGEMKIPPAYLYPSRPVPVLWSVLLGTALCEWTWEGYAATSTEATERAIDWLRDKHQAEGFSPAIRVLEVLQVGT